MKFFKTLFASCLGVILAFFLLGAFVFGAILFASSKFMPQSDADKEDIVLTLPLDGVIADYYEEEILQNVMNSKHQVTSLHDILVALERAKTDDRVKGISLRMNSIGAGYATAQEIRKAILNFKESGKFVYAYSGIYSQGAYYIASAADFVCLNPEGALSFSGISSSSLFFKGFLQKVGVEMQVVRCGAYKSYAESFVNDTMSAENREQMEDLIGSIWDVVLDDVSADRKLDRVFLAHMADEYLVVKPAAFLQANRLVDNLLYLDEYENLIRQNLSISKDQKVPYMDVNEYLTLSEELVPSSEWSDKIALVYLSGEIDNGNTDGINSGKTVRLLEEIEQDSTIKGVVLRVNSPGGGAYGSEQICHMVQRLKTHKPVVASFGDYAASGGYYIASNADKIVSNKTTVTGSIGVIAMVPNAKDLADKLGVHYETVKTNRNADLMENIFRPLTDQERVAVQASADQFYSTFLRRCSEGRNMSVDQIHAYAQGRVWSGEDARKLNLVDSLGTMSDAIGMAAEMANLTDYELVEYPKKRNLWEQLEDFPSVGYEKLFGNDVFSKEKFIFEKIQCLERVQAIIPYTIELR